MRRERGFTIIELLMVVTLLALLVAVALPCLMRSQLVARQAHACGMMKSLIGHEVLWHTQDPDRNGMADYWVRDLRGMHAIPAPDGKAVAVVDRDAALADRCPAFAYGPPLNVSVPDQGYYVQAIVSDQDGMPYVDASLPPPDFGPAAASCSNRNRFGFSAFPEKYGRDGIFVYVVTEDGVIWEKDDGKGSRVLERARVGMNTSWRLSGS